MAPDQLEVDARLTPHLPYHDCDAAVEFLVDVPGFREARHGRRGRKTNHAKLEREGGLIMLGTPGGEYRNPDQLGGRTQTTCVHVDDVDAALTTRRKHPAQSSRAGSPPSSTETEPTRRRAAKGTPGRVRATSTTSRPRSCRPRPPKPRARVSRATHR